MGVMLDRRRTRQVVTAAIWAVLGLGLAGCETVDDWFSPGEEDKLPGERISIMNLDVALEADPRLAGIDILLPEPVTNPDWPQPGGKPDNALHHLAGDGALEPVWSVSAGAGSDDQARLTAPPIIAGGTVYVLDAEATVRAFRASDGDRLWAQELTPEDEDPEEGRGGGVAFSGAHVIAVTGFGTVHALNPGSGEITWTTNLGQPVRAAPTVDGGRVFIVTSDNQAVGLDAANGEILWRHRGITESAGILAATSPAVAGPIVVAPYSSGELYAIRVENGNPVWSDSLTRTGNLTSLTELSDIAGRPVIDRGRVYAVSHAGRMVCVDERSGERVWTRTITGIQTPWIAGDYIFMVTTDAQLLALSKRDGRIRWVSQLQRFRNEETRNDPIQWSGPVLVGEQLVIVSSRGIAIAASPYDGEVQARIELPDGVLIPPVVADGTVYILTDSAELVALR